MEYSYEYKKRILNIANYKSLKYEEEAKYQFLLGNTAEYNRINSLNNDLKAITKTSTDEMDFDVVQTKKLLTQLYKVCLECRNYHLAEEVSTSPSTGFNYTLNFTLTS